MKAASGYLATVAAGTIAFVTLFCLLYQVAGTVWAAPVGLATALIVVLADLLTR